MVGLRVGVNPCDQFRTNFTGKCLYIDTEGTFRPERLLAVAERFSFLTLWSFYWRDCALQIISLHLTFSPQVWTSRQWRPWQRGICKGLQLRPSVDPSHPSELCFVELFGSAVSCSRVFLLILQTRDPGSRHDVGVSVCSGGGGQCYRSLQVVTSTLTLYKLGQECKISMTWHE